MVDWFLLVELHNKIFKICTKCWFEIEYCLSAHAPWMPFLTVFKRSCWADWTMKVNCVESMVGRRIYMKFFVPPPTVSLSLSYQNSNPNPWRMDGKKRARDLAQRMQHDRKIKHPPNVEKQCKRMQQPQPPPRLVMRKDYFVKNCKPTTFCARAICLHGSVSVVT